MTILFFSVRFVVSLNNSSHSCSLVDHSVFLPFTSSTTKNVDNVLFIVGSSLDIRVVSQPIFVVCPLLSLISSRRPAMNQSLIEFCIEGKLPGSFNFSANSRFENSSVPISTSTFPGFQNS